MYSRFSVAAGFVGIGSAVVTTPPVEVRVILASEDAPDSCLAASRNVHATK
jgi:hypothetical protein